MLILVSPHPLSLSIPVATRHSSQGGTSNVVRARRGGQAARLGTIFRGFCWCNGHGKRAVSGHPPGSSLPWVQEAFPEAGGVTWPPSSGKVNRAGTGLIPAGGAFAETLPQVPAGWWVDRARPWPYVGGQADGETPERLCCPRGNSPPPSPFPRPPQGPCCHPAGAEGPGAKGQHAGSALRVGDVGHRDIFLVDLSWGEGGLPGLGVCFPSCGRDWLAE